jgi:hypothetical protein
LSIVLCSSKKLTANVYVCAVVGFRSRHCPRGQTLNEDNTLNLHVTPPLRKHFVGNSWVSSVFVSRTYIFSVSIGLKSTCCQLSTKPNSIFLLSLVNDLRYVQEL